MPSTAARGDKCRECGEQAGVYTKLGISIREGVQATEIIGDGACEACVLGAVESAVRIGPDVLYRSG